VVKLVYTRHSKCRGSNLVSVRVRPAAPHKFKNLNKFNKSKKLAYIIGIAIGDGNLSNPNGRAVRLRISCDNKYPKLIKRISKNISELFPKNKVSLIKRKDNCTDISCYSNRWELILGWKAKDGSKFKQKISIPKWIKASNDYIKPCLKGLLETDGSIYFDRKYIMVNFVTIIPTIANDFIEITKKIGYNPNIQKIKIASKKIKHTIRISRNTKSFIDNIKISKN